MLRSLFTAGACAVVLSIAAPAAAQHGGWTPRTQGSRVGIDFGIWPTDDIKTFPFAIVGQFEVIRSLHIDFELPWAIAATTPEFGDGDSEAIFGNPTFGLHYGGMISRRVGLYAGGTISISPHLDGDFDNAIVAVLATAANGYGDFHRYFPEYLFVRPRVGVEIQGAPFFYYRGDLVPMILGPIGEGARDTEFIVETFHDFEFRAPMGVGGGFRLQGVFLATFDREFDDDDDTSQLAMEPFFAYEPPNGHFYARVGLLIALDEPLGFGFNEGKVATVRTSLGGKW
jgi:hypothetical protein